MSIEIARAFAHRTYGDIGKVSLVAPDGEYKLNGETLPPTSVNHLLTFALQTLQDAYAGAKSADEAQGAFNGKLDKLLNGTIGTRSSGSSVTERDKVARIIVGAWFRDAYGKDTPERQKYDDADATGRYAIIDKIWADNEAVFAEAVDEEVAARKAKADKLGGLKVKISL